MFCTHLEYAYYQIGSLLSNNTYLPSTSRPYAVLWAWWAFMGDLCRNFLLNLLSCMILRKNGCGLIGELNTKPLLIALNKPFVRPRF
jgi:hypothetical protein